MGGPRSVSEIDAVIGKNVRYLRMASDYSQEHLAAEIGVTFQQIQKYESGKDRISSSTLYKFSQILDVSIHDFFAGLKDSPDKKTSFEKIGRSVLENDAMQILTLYHQLDSKQKKNLKAILKLMG